MIFYMLSSKINTVPPRSSHDPVIGMFHCHFIDLKIPLFSMPSRPGHFLRIRQWGGQLQKGTILYQVWRNDRWLLVTKILVWYGI